MSDTKRWLILGGLVFLGFLIYWLSPVLTPFLIAATLAYLTDPLVNRLQKWHLPRVLAVSMVFIFLLFLFILGLLFILPLLEQELVLLVSKLPKIINWLQNEILPWLARFLPGADSVNLQSMQETFSKNASQAGGAIGTLLKTISTSGMVLVGFFTNLVLIPVVMFYLLRDWKKLITGIHELLPRRIEPATVVLVKESDEVLSAFIRGQLMVMLGLSILYTIGLRIAGLDLAMLIGSISGLVSIVPYLGFIVGVSAATIAAVIQYHDWIHVLYVFIAFGVAQSIESSLLTPLLIGDKIGLHPVAVIFSVLAGGQLFGFMGILLALPVAAVVMVFIRFFKKKYILSELYSETAEER